MVARADAAEATARAIIRAVVELVTERYLDQISLADIAQRAGVTVQTVLRHFGSKSGLIQAAADVTGAEVHDQRWLAPAGDVEGAIDNLLDHYADFGATALRLLAQEDRVPELGGIVANGRAVHRDWVRHAFGPLVGRGPAADAVLTQLTVVTDVYVWKLLHLDMGHDRPTTRALLISLVHGVLGDRRPT